MNINRDTLMAQARDEAKRYHHKYIRTEHLLIAVLNSSDLGLDVDCIRSAIAFLRCPTCDAEEQMILSASAQRAWELAESYTDGQSLTHEHILLGILQSSLTVRKLLKSCGVEVSTIVADLEGKIQHGK